MMVKALKLTHPMCIVVPVQIGTDALTLILGSVLSPESFL